MCGHVIDSLFPWTKVGDSMLMSLLCCHCKDFLCAPSSSCPIFFKFRSHVSCTCTKIETPINFEHFVNPFVARRGQKCFSCVHTGDLSFQLIFFIFAPNMHWSKVYTPINFQGCEFPFVHTRGPKSFVLCVHCKPQSFQLIFLRLTPYTP